MRQAEKSQLCVVEPEVCGRVTGARRGSACQDPGMFPSFLGCAMYLFIGSHSWRMYYSIGFAAGLGSKTAECDSLQGSLVGFLSWMLTSREIFAGEDDFTNCGETPNLIELLIVLSSASTQHVALERQTTPTQILYEGWYSEKAQEHVGKLRDQYHNAKGHAAS